ncbi:MAG: carbohydrate porin [Chthoniobacterales bacterium]
MSPARAEVDAAAGWWHGQHMTGDWFGARTAVEDRGVDLRGRWRGIYFGILDSEQGAGNAFAQELSFWLDLDAAKLAGWEGLRGLSGFVEGRWRDPGPEANPNTYVEADSLFNPSRYAGGTGWRLMNFGLRYAVPEFVGVKDGLVVTAGWLQPQKEFVTQPLARLFANNAMGSAEGLGGNIPYGSSFSTWGGVLEVRPVERLYIKGGLYMSYFNPTDPANRGLHFHGSRSEGNGLFFMGETGITPEFGAERLPGSYSFGGYFYGEDNEEFGGNKYGFYGQGEQMVWREDGEQGLRAFSLFYFAPPENNDFSFYTQAGLVYQGLVPQRDRDLLMAAVAVGQYGDAAAPSAGQSVFVEAGYQVRLNDWAFVQPFVQLVTRPAGTSAVGDAAILGVFLGVDF